MKIAQVAVALSLATAAYGKGSSMKVVANVPDVSGREAAFAADGHRWAVGDGARLHLGRDGKLEQSLVLPATPRGALAFVGDSQVRWGATLTSGDHATSEPAAHSALQAALPPSPGGIEVGFVASSADGALTAAVGRTRASARLDGPTGAQEAALVLVAAAHPVVVWKGAIAEAPSRLLVTPRTLVAVGTGVLVADAHTGKIIAQHANAVGGTVNALGLDDQAFYTAAADGTVAAWDLATGAKRWSVAVSHQPLRALAIAHGTLVVAGWDDKLRVLSPSDGKQVEELALGNHGEAVALSPDGTRLLVALGGARGELRLYDLAR